MTILAAPGDTIRVSAKDVTQLDEFYVAQPVTSGLAGTVNLHDWDSGTLEDGPHVLTNNASADDWYVDFDAPGIGHYRIAVVITVGGAQRTLAGELRVESPPT